MTNGLLGKKLGMTQVFDDSRLTPVTVIEAGPCRVVTVKTKERDGYEAVQLSFGEVKERKLSKAELGHLKKHQAPASRWLREFQKDGDVTVGQSVTVSMFKKGRLGGCGRDLEGQGVPGGGEAASLRWRPRIAWFNVSSCPRINWRQLLSFPCMEGEDLAGPYGCRASDDSTAQGGGFPPG